MQETNSTVRNVKELLIGPCYSIEYYQREYKWGKKQLSELINDLTSSFKENYKEGHKRSNVQAYGHYFLGSIVVSKTNAAKQIVDGQQRLTTITLLLIYLNNWRKKAGQPVNIIENLIFDEDDEKFKLSIPDHESCMEALFHENAFDPKGKSESVRNLYVRYKDLGELFSKQLTEEQRPLFIKWLTEKVQMVEISACADYDAYTIFETMNERGLSLNSTDMLNGYLLAKIENPQKRQEAYDLIKKMLQSFAEHNKNTGSDFFKVWLRAKYARKIDARKKQAKHNDYELIDTGYHRWVRENRNVIGLKSSDDFHRWITEDMDHFAKLYIKLLEASNKCTKGLESVYYNDDLLFPRQHFDLHLAPAKPDEGMELSLKKAGLIADFVDCLLNRILGPKSIYFFMIDKEPLLPIIKIRGKSMNGLRTYLVRHLESSERKSNFSHLTWIGRGRRLHIQLARIIDWLEQESGQRGRYDEYVQEIGEHFFEIEHIWPKNRFQRYPDEFSNEEEFNELRSNIGGLLLLPKKVNASLNNMAYEDKLNHYLKQNLLAQSLHPLAYKNNPDFKKVINKHGLPFKAYPEFNKTALEERNDLYCKLADKVWSIDRLKAKR